jgi:hypothetical protein
MLMLEWWSFPLIANTNVLLLFMLLYNYTYANIHELINMLIIYIMFVSSHWLVWLATPAVWGHAYSLFGSDDRCDDQNVCSCCCESSCVEYEDCCPDFAPVCGNGDATQRSVRTQWASTNTTTLLRNLPDSDVFKTVGARLGPNYGTVWADCQNSQTIWSIIWYYVMSYKHGSYSQSVAITVSCALTAVFN